MRKIEIFNTHDLNITQEGVNEFIKDKEVIDIQFNTIAHTKNKGISFSVMIVYEVER